MTASPPATVVYSTLSADYLREHVLAAYPLPAPLECRFWTRDLNDLFLVRTAGTASERYVLRLSEAGRRTEADLRFELEFLLHLRRAGVAVGTPVVAADGELLHAVPAPEGVRYAALFTFAPGQPLELDEAQSPAFGRAVAALHTAAATFASAHRRFVIDEAWLLEAPFDTIAPLLRHRLDDLDYLRRLAERVRAQIAAASAAGLTPLVCHGDLQGKNAHLADDGTITFFDFDGCGPSWLAYDLAWCRLSVKSDAAWNALLAAYTDLRPVAEADLAAVPLFHPAIILWNMGMQLSHAPLWGFRWYGSQAYFDSTLRRLRTWEASHGARLKQAR